MSESIRYIRASDTLKFTEERNLAHSEYANSTPATCGRGLKNKKHYRMECFIKTKTKNMGGPHVRYRKGDLFINLSQKIQMKWNTSTVKTPFYLTIWCYVT